MATLLAGLALSAGARAADPDRVEWSSDWPSVRWWEVADAVVLTVGDTEIEQQVAIPAKPHWTGPVLFDDWARQVFRGNTPAVQSAASTVSDVFYYGGVLVPFIVDDYFVSLEVHEKSRSRCTRTPRWRRRCSSSTCSRSACPAS
jgi:hypothetical protein